MVRLAKPSESMAATSLAIVNSWTLSGLCVRIHLHNRPAAARLRCSNGICDAPAEFVRGAESAESESRAAYKYAESKGTPGHGLGVAHFAGDGWGCEEVQSSYGFASP